MILYELKCSNEHHFEAWFKDSAAYDKQVKRGEIECPVCSETQVSKAIMAPNVSTSRRREGSESRAEEVATEILQAVGKLQKYVENNCEDVGDRFAEEARAIHNGEAEARGIYGEATREEAEELIEEEIPVLPLPKRPRKHS